MKNDQPHDVDRDVDRDHAPQQAAHESAELQAQAKAQHQTQGRTADAPRPKRGFAGFVARGALYPFARVGEQISQSRSNIAQLRAAQAVRQQEFNRKEALRRQKMRDAGIALPDDAQRFEAMYEAFGWTPEKLDQQLRTVILTRRFALGATVAGVLMALGGMIFQDSRWLTLVMCLVASAVCAIGMARAMQFGLMQAQIEERRLMRWREYVARADFFKHIFS